MFAAKRRDKFLQFVNDNLVTATAAIGGLVQSVERNEDKITSALIYYTAYNMNCILVTDRLTNVTHPLRLSTNKSSPNNSEFIGDTSTFSQRLTYPKGEYCKRSNIRKM